MVVGINDADHFRVSGSVLEREVECTRLGADQPLDMQEAEVIAEKTAMLLHRPPERRVCGVVVDHQHLEVRVAQARQRVERRDHKVGWFGMGGNVQRDLGVVDPCHRGRADTRPLPPLPAEHLPALEHLYQRSRQ